MNRPGRSGRTGRGSVRAVGLLATLLVVLLTAGCGLFGGSSTENEGGDTDAAARSKSLEKTKLNVGMMVGIDCAGAQLALLEDAFQEEGLEVVSEIVQSGATAIPKLAGGGLDVTFGNWVSFLKAQVQGVVDLRFVSESYLSTPNSNFAVLAAPNSGINGPKDLVGKTVAVNAKANINELLLRAVLEANDVAFDQVNIVELPFPAMADAMKNNQVQAAATIDPFVTDAQQKVGAKIAFDLTGTGPTESFPLSGFAVTAKFAKENPNTVAAFQRALLKGQQSAADRSKIQDALQMYADMKPETAAIVRYGSYPTTIDPKRLQRVADLLRTYQMIDKDIEVEPLVVPVPSASG